MGIDNEISFDMKNKLTRRKFLIRSAGIGIGCCLPVAGIQEATSKNTFQMWKEKPLTMKNGEKQLFVDDVLINRSKGVIRKIHPAKKLSQPVVKGDKPWEYVEQNGKKFLYAALYGTVLKDEATGVFRMWYNINRKTCYAESKDGIHWQKPELGQLGKNNMINLFDFHSPSIILDMTEPDPAKRYKAIGSKEGFSKDEINKLKAKFHSPEWYTRKHAYCAAYSADGINWEMYPDPVLLGMDTITFAKNPNNGEYLAFHKQTKDPRSYGRQVFLSTSMDMKTGQIRSWLWLQMRSIMSMPEN